ncbi:hypothetical protein BESB_043360 [Besnoitia besnoiti]|uniref:DUF1308 domain-containing protein n=1 Tax=Besnoitia besnoiti TaxID=94643 RepID=A0A2A9MG40_BESBE|nr:hypothetical protein BESB_043360 [Besnoitia besnoiti]PFH36144.1 hypothetical protein BESB_043360 [Besnoitia besnoiti]
MPCFRGPPSPTKCPPTSWPKMLQDFLVSKGLTGINLDTTSFVAACSELTHDPENVEASLSDADKKKRIAQIDDEHRNRRYLLRLFESLFKEDGPHVYVSDVVMEEVSTIFRSFAGPRERDRATILFSRVKNSKESLREYDVCDVSHHLLGQRSKHMKPRHQRIFMDGIQRRLLTLTADKAFVSACRHRGFDLVVEGWVLEHSPRSLTGL